VKFGGGKTIRDGMGQSQRPSGTGVGDAMDTVITNAVIVPGIRWPARLHLHATRDGAATRLRHTHHGPLRLLKTLHPEGPGIAHAVLVHPPGGLVGGDRLDVDIGVASGAHLLVTNPAATRFYRSTAGVAAQRLHARAADGARLEWLPQETLAYDGCEALNSWRVQLEGSASLMAMEVLALGLALTGQPFSSGRFEQRLAIDGLWREHGVIDARDAALLDGPCGLAGHRVLGTLVFAAGEPFAPAWAEAALDAARATMDADADSTTGTASLFAGATALQSPERRQQDARLGLRDALGQPHALEHLRQLGHVLGAQFGQQVPAAVRVVQAFDAGFAEQARDDGARLVAVDAHAHPGADAVGLRVGAQAQAVADDDLAVFELAQAVADGAARDAELGRQRRDGHARVAAQQRDQLPVDVVHGHAFGHAPSISARRQRLQCRLPRRRSHRRRKPDGV